MPTLTPIEARSDFECAFTLGHACADLLRMWCATLHESTPVLGEHGTRRSDTRRLWPDSHGLAVKVTVLATLPYPSVHEPALGARRAREMVILGTQYAGEMKKGIFTVMHYFMPKRGILSLHSGCNVGAANDVSLFFGLSGVLGSPRLHTFPEVVLALGFVGH